MLYVRLRQRTGPPTFATLIIFVSFSAVAAIGFLAVRANAESKTKQSAVAATEQPIDTTVCAVGQNPVAFNNKLVRLRGLAVVSNEFSMVEGYGCAEAIWLTYADSFDSSGPTLNHEGLAVPGGTDSAGVPIIPIPVHLVKNADLRRYQELLRKAFKAERSTSPARYGVVATLVGRVDSVSAEVHAAHLKEDLAQNPDWKAFGEGGEFDAQLVVESVQGPSELNVEFYIPPSQLQ